MAEFAVVRASYSYNMAINNDFLTTVPEAVKSGLLPFFLFIGKLWQARFAFKPNKKYVNNPSILDHYLQHGCTNMREHCRQFYFMQK
jgi:hypothetical protein